MVYYISNWKQDNSTTLSEFGQEFRNPKLLSLLNSLSRTTFRAISSKFQSREDQHPHNSIIAIDLFPIFPYPNVFMTKCFRHHNYMRSSFVCQS
uniref:Putative ovule protein n=1 Tax=Solanum chacoense TaxID=4108 RepID=A0A0V0GUD6_SOLCH